jgi:hypothetical protein
MHQARVIWGNEQLSPPATNAHGYVIANAFAASYIAGLDPVQQVQTGETGQHQSLDERCRLGGTTAGEPAQRIRIS